MTKEERDQFILQIYQKSGSSIRQLSRVLGLGKRVIEKVILGDK